MHAARLESSSRLKRVFELLADGREHSTQDIVRGAGVCAVNSIIAELRAGRPLGRLEIERRQVVEPLFGRIRLYRMSAGGGGS